ncbi:caspase family protein [Ensifer sp.]|jgi:uncharacterized caspase-like protein|uniref:caspase family protein n=1 Tax=Ensifer sp. TaxID=1872086 RepID=UPI002E1505D0|nr:caspase family protein [Ensifer sp.]
MRVILWHRLLFCLMLALPIDALASVRHALLIGNSRYEVATPLRNPENDIEIVGAALEKSGFAVTKVANATASDTLSAIDAFVSRLAAVENPVVMVYFAGHGVQLAGENYLLPVDVKLGSEEELRTVALSLGDLARRLDAVRSSLQIVVLDSCRNNPFEQTRGLQRGLATAPERLGRIVAYSTSPGNVATDGDTGASPYATALAESVTIPGLSIEGVFKRVRATVQERTSGKQEPWENSAVYGDFSFVEAKPAATGDDEVAFFEFAALADSQEAYRKYLSRYPQGMFASLARQKITFMDKDFSFRRQNETFRKFAFKRDDEDFCKRVGFVNSFADGEKFPADNEIILLDIYYEFHTKVCPDVGYLGYEQDPDTGRFKPIWSALSAYGQTYSNFPKAGVVDPAILKEHFAEFDTNMFYYRIFDDAQFSVVVAPFDPSLRAFYSYDSCIASCISLRALVRTHIEADEESTTYRFEVVDAAELGMSWKYQNTLNRADAPEPDQLLASYVWPIPQPPVPVIDELAAGPFRKARDLSGWNIVAVVGEGGALVNCRAMRPQRGAKMAMFRLYPGGALSFGYFDPASSLDPAYSGFAGYLVDGQTGGIVPIKAYSTQELAYSIGSEKRVLDQLKAGRQIELANEKTDLAGSRAVLDLLQQCVVAFGG